MEVVTTLLATVGAILSIISNIPQVYRVWKIPNKRSTDDISPLAICIHMLAALLWSIYGFMLHLYILGVESFVVFLLYTLILGAIIKDHFLYRGVKPLKKLYGPI